MLFLHSESEINIFFVKKKKKKEEVKFFDEYQKKLFRECYTLHFYASNVKATKIGLLVLINL